jgi:hypothetical protein
VGYANGEADGIKSLFQIFLAFLKKFKSEKSHFRDICPIGDSFSLLIFYNN